MCHGHNSAGERQAPLLPTQLVSATLHGGACGCSAEGRAPMRARGGSAIPHARSDTMRAGHRRSLLPGLQSARAPRLVGLGAGAVAVVACLAWPGYRCPCRWIQWRPAPAPAQAWPMVSGCGGASHWQQLSLSDHQVSRWKKPGRIKTAVSLFRFQSSSVLGWMPSLSTLLCCY